MARDPLVRSTATAASKEGTDASAETLQLLVAEKGNRTALRDLLSSHYEVDDSPTVRDADLYIVDDHTFPDYHDELRERVERSDPVFCPVVLIRRRDSSIRISLSAPDERDGPVLIDDIVDAPIDRGILFRRIDTLLVRRRQSLELLEYVGRLEESNRALEQFAHAVSHDLQEPLRMVSSYVGLIEERYGDTLDEDGIEFIRFALDGAERMRKMIDGLLEYSRVDSGGDPFDSVDLNAVLGDVRIDLQVKIGEEDARITADALPSVEGDASQLRQLFQNLLSNAIEYHGDEPPRIHVSAAREGDEWAISVRDEGIGIPPEQQDRVFELFTRLHAPEEYSGTGLGLTLCRRIVERHGGRIRVESEPERGSTFTFTLPVPGEAPG